MSDKLKALCLAVQKMTASKVDEVPEGWFSADQIAKQSNIDPSTAVRRMKGMIKSGDIEVRKFKTMTSRGIYPVPYYRLKEEPNQCNPRKSRQPR